jgi:hypothetical protein
MSRLANEGQVKRPSAAPLVVLALLASCSTPDTQAVDLVEDLAKSVKQAGADCAAACDALDTWNAAWGTRVDALRKGGVGTDEAAKERLKKKAGARVDALAKDLAGQLTCFGGMSEAFASYDVLGAATATCRAPEEALELAEGMADLLFKNAGNCDKAAEALEEWTKKNGARQAKLSEALGKARAKYPDRVNAIAQATVSVALNCMANERFSKALSASKKSEGGAAPAPSK